VSVFPNNELGAPVGLMAQARAGSVDVVALSSLVLSNDLSGMALPTIGFAFADYDRLWSAMDGTVGSGLRDLLRDRLGLIAMSRCWDFGFRQVTTSGKPIQVAGDIAGFRLRTPAEADFINLFQALKAVPIGLPLNNLGQALKSHVVDGQEGMLALAKVAKLYEVQATCALTNHVWDGQWVCVSAKSWARLPGPLRDVVAAALDESGLRQRQDIATAAAQFQKDLEALGMRFNSVDASSFRSVLRDAGYYAAWRAKVGDAAMASLEKYTGRLA
jgi:TRAP-type C4-dicarboxylate transport system substrate-binding protein